MRARIIEITPPPADPVMSAGAETTVSSTKEDIVQATAGFDLTRAKSQEGMEKVMATAEDFVAFGQGNVEAFKKSGEIWAAGVQDLSKQVAATAKASYDDSVATFKALAGVKSLKEAFDLQTAFARSAIEKALAESGKLTDASLKLTEQTLAPITARITVAVDKFSKAA